MFQPKLHMYTPKYHDQFLMGLLETFTTGLIFARQSKQGPQYMF